MPARKVAEILFGASDLQALAIASRRIAELQQAYLDAAPDGLAEVSQILGARSGVLFVAAESGAVAAKLRHLAPRILARYRQLGHEFNSMRVEVQVAAIRASSSRRSTKPLSQSALAAIQATRETLPEGALKAALARLGRTRKS